MTLHFARRGVHNDCPENSTYAYRAAAKAGKDGIYIEIRKTADGQLVCADTDNIGYLSDRQGRINQMTLAQLKECYFWGRYPERYIDFYDEKLEICTLAEALDIAKETKLKVILDLSEEANDDSINKAYKLVKERNMLDTVIFCIRMHYDTMKLRAIDKNIKVCVNYEDVLEQPWNYFTFFNPDYVMLPVSEFMYYRKDGKNILTEEFAKTKIRLAADCSENTEYNSLLEADGVDIIVDEKRESRYL